MARSGLSDQVSFTYEKELTHTKLGGKSPIAKDLRWEKAWLLRRTEKRATWL